jgi:hypothetical protein
MNDATGGEAADWLIGRLVGAGLQACARRWSRHRAASLSLPVRAK